jgi:hypothetical protein
MKPTYTLGFVVVWGLGLGISLAVGGLLSFAAIATLLLMLVHHEHAHLKKMEERGCLIHSITFGAFGGMLVNRDTYPQDQIDIHAAGVINSGVYAAAFTALLLAITWVARESGWNLVDPMPNGLLYWLQFLRSISLMAIVLVLSNLAPIGIHTKEYGFVATDGYACWLKREARDELWNDGKIGGLS